MIYAPIYNINDKGFAERVRTINNMRIPDSSVCHTVGYCTICTLVSVSLFTSVCDEYSMLMPSTIAIVSITEMFWQFRCQNISVYAANTIVQISRFCWVSFCTHML